MHSVKDNPLVTEIEVYRAIDKVYGAFAELRAPYISDLPPEFRQRDLRELSVPEIDRALSCLGPYPPEVFLPAYRYFLPRILELVTSPSLDPRIARPTGYHLSFGNVCHELQRFDFRTWPQYAALQSWLRSIWTHGLTLPFEPEMDAWGTYASLFNSGRFLFTLAQSDHAVLDFLVDLTELPVRLKSWIEVISVFSNDWAPESQRPAVQAVVLWIVAPSTIHFLEAQFLHESDPVRNAQLSGILREIEFLLNTWNDCIQNGASGYGKVSQAVKAIRDGDFLIRIGRAQGERA